MIITMIIISAIKIVLKSVVLEKILHHLSHSCFGVQCNNVVEARYLVLARLAHIPRVCLYIGLLNSFQETSSRFPQVEKNLDS